MATTHVTQKVIQSTRQKLRSGYEKELTVTEVTEHQSDGGSIVEFEAVVRVDGREIARAVAWSKDAAIADATSQYGAWYVALAK